MSDPTQTVLLDIERQMTMRRPWDVADDWSQWVITGAYPKGRGTFTDCLAVVLPRHIGGAAEGAPAVFAFVGPLSLAGPDLIPASWITRAEPMLLVRRDDPCTACWEHEQVYLQGGPR